MNRATRRMLAKRGHKKQTVIGRPGQSYEETMLQNPGAIRLLLAELIKVEKLTISEPLEKLQDDQIKALFSHVMEQARTGKESKATLKFEEAPSERA